MKLVFLGTGGSYPTPKRNVSALALKYKGEVILFDCGEGTQRQFMRSSISFMDTKKIFVTHFHGDHFLGIPGLIQSMNLNNRQDDLEIYGPLGTTKFVKELIKMGYFNPGFQVKIQDLKPEAEVRFSDYYVSSIKAEHNIPSLAYKFKEKDKVGRFDKQKALDLGIPEGPLFSKIQQGMDVKVNGNTITPDQILGPPRMGRTIVYSGDTKPCMDIMKASLNTDVLIHDGTLESSLSDEAVKRGHSSVRHAAEIAKKANVEKLFITHISPRYEHTAFLENEARKIFKESYIPQDLSVFDV